MLLFFAFACWTVEFASAQNVGIGTSSPNPAALLDVNSNNSGFLPPRMNFGQRNAISNPVAGLMVYCSDCDSSGQLQVFNGARWCNMMGGVATDPLFAYLPTVVIGTQKWSSKNLDVSTYRNGDPIPQVTGSSQWSSLTTGAWCWYNNDSATFAATYGKLYNWYAVNDPRGLAPRGWHVPTDAEWNKMTKFLDPSLDTTAINWAGSNIGGILKETGTSHWASPNTGANNSSGFTALPGGNRHYYGTCYNFSNLETWWTASAYDATNAWYRSVVNNTGYIGRNNYDKRAGYAVRVVRD